MGVLPILSKEEARNMLRVCGMHPPNNFDSQTVADLKATAAMLRGARLECLRAGRRLKMAADVAAASGVDDEADKLYIRAANEFRVAWYERDADECMKRVCGAA